ncbi:OmpA family protein [Sulfurimonas sp. SAG-AH-194-L11]|nr:OmpA family protein [Sulfurimonas sp. SAG-AH-194-L11]MDF1877581.1 OmpA family protein [Sulfurimonas sp. SAG-AH-194-L11]
MKIYFILLLLLLSTLGCSSKEKPVPKQVEPLQIKTQEHNTTTVDKKSTFNEANFINEDATTHIFYNCFKTGSISLEKTCKKKIDKFLKTTSLKNKRNILIEVHTDRGGSRKKNLDISTKRAKVIAKSFYYKEYKNSKVYYKGFGKSKLIYDEETAEANFQNRRVIIKLRSKKYKPNTKEYKLFIKKKQQKQRKQQKTIHKKIKKLHKKQVDILSYTGEADTGWIYFGKPKLAKKFTIRCTQDKPLKVKHKAISKSKRSEFLSTFYDRKISASFADYKFEVYPIYIYENGKLPISNPMVSLNDGEKTLRFQTTVNTYRGKEGILYRIFINGRKKVSCVDLVISDKDDKVSYGHIYMKDGKDFVLSP